MGNGNAKKKPTMTIRNSLFVTDLSNYLQKYAQHFLYEGSRLTISINALQIINELLSYLPELKEAVEQHSFKPIRQWKLKCGLITRLDANVVWDIDLIANIIRSVTNVQIIGNEGEDSLMEVDLSNFLGMKKLELRCVSIQMVRNIRRCRSNLECISVCKSLSNLTSLFEECGWDQSFASNWSRLQFANLRENKLTQLDNSLRLLNILTVLDLSRNLLDNLNGLENLHCLKRLNVSYNYLCDLPCLSTEQKLKLEVLLICFNSIESLTNISDFKNLSIFDARGNLISNDVDIEGLSELEDLGELRLSENPISFDKNYRLTIIRKLSHRLLPQNFLLDGLHLSKQENSHLRSVPPSWWPIIQSPIPSPLEDSFPSAGHLTQPSSFTTEENTSEFSSLSKPPTSKKRSRRVRLMEEEDQSDARNSCEADVSSSEPENTAHNRGLTTASTLNARNKGERIHSTPKDSGPESNLSEEAQRTRERIEQLKQNSDTNNWLTNLNRSLNQLGIPSPSSRTSMLGPSHSTPSLTPKDEGQLSTSSTIKIYPTPEESSSTTLDGSSATATSKMDSLANPSLSKNASFTSVRFLSCLTCNAGFLESKAKRHAIDNEDQAFLTTRSERGDLVKLACPYCEGDLLKDQQRSAVISAPHSMEEEVKQPTSECPASPPSNVPLVVDQTPQEVTSHQEEPAAVEINTKIAPEENGSPGYSTEVPQLVGHTEAESNCKFYVGSCSSVSDYCGSPTHWILPQNGDAIGEEDEEQEKDSTKQSLTSSIEIAPNRNPRDAITIEESPYDAPPILNTPSRPLASSITSTSSQASSLERYFNAANPNVGGALHWIEFDFSDFSHMDHNLQLHLDVTYLQKGEDLKFVLKTFSIPPGKIHSMESILLLTDQRLYLMEIKDHSSKDLDRCIKLIEKSDLDNLQSLETGYFEQSFMMEFCKPNRRYLFMTGDEKITRNFIKQILSMYEDTFPKIYAKRSESFTHSAQLSVNDKIISRFISSLDVSEEVNDIGEGLGVTESEENATVQSKIEKAYLVRKLIVNKGKDKLLPKGHQWCYLVLTPTHLLTIVCKYSSKHAMDYVLDRCVELPMIASASCGDNNELTINSFDSNDAEPFTVTFLSSHTRHFALTYLGELWSNIFRVAFEIV